MAGFGSPNVKEQDQVAAFVADNDMGSDPAYRILDLAAEIGEIAADATKSTEWARTPRRLT